MPLSKSLEQFFAPYTPPKAGEATARGVPQDGRAGVPVEQVNTTYPLPSDDPEGLDVLWLDNVPIPPPGAGYVEFPNGIPLSIKVDKQTKAGGKPKVKKTAEDLHPFKVRVNIFEPAFPAMRTVALTLKPSAKTYKPRHQEIDDAGHIAVMVHEWTSPRWDRTKKMGVWEFGLTPIDLSTQGKAGGAGSAAGAGAGSGPSDDELAARIAWVRAAIEAYKAERFKEAEARGEQARDRPPVGSVEEGLTVELKRLLEEQKRRGEGVATPGYPTGATQPGDKATNYARAGGSIPAADRPEKQNVKGASNP